LFQKRQTLTPTDKIIVVWGGGGINLLIIIVKSTEMMGKYMDIFTAPSKEHSC
jgi:hypothetical protein